MATDQQAPGSPLLKLPEEVRMMILRKVSTLHKLEVELADKPARSLILAI